MGYSVCYADQAFVCAPPANPTARRTKEHERPSSLDVRPSCLNPRKRRFFARRKIRGMTESALIARNDSTRIDRDFRVLDGLKSTPVRLHARALIIHTRFSPMHTFPLVLARHFRFSTKSDYAQAKRTWLDNFWCAGAGDDVQARRTGTLNGCISHFPQCPPRSTVRGTGPESTVEDRGIRER
jgi:hypothetical protein